MVLEQEVPPAAWQPLASGYQGLEVQRSYGGIAQRWLLVESAERAGMESERLQHQVIQGEQEAQKALRRLAARPWRPPVRRFSSTSWCASGAG